MKFRHLLVTSSVAAIMSLSTAAYAKNLSTAEFVQKASIANQFEIQSSQLALDKTNNAKVKEFAQTMVDDHTMTGGKMETALEASKSKAKPAEDLDAKHANLIAKLDGASGTAFDKQYIEMQTKAHKEAVSLFSSYATNGKDPALREFAESTLPALKEHYAHVQQLSAK